MCLGLLGITKQAKKNPSASGKGRDGSWLKINTAAKQIPHRMGVELNTPSDIQSDTLHLYQTNAVGQTQLAHL